MADVSKDATLIKVHGREALNIPYTRYQKTATGRETQIDISNSNIYFEVPGADMRVKLIANPGDPKGLLVRLSREQVETLPITATAFAVVDETAFTNVDGVITLYPDVEWEGMIQRVGYVGAP